MSKAMIIALALATVIAGPALARQHEKTIVVTSGPTTLAHWSTGFTRQLERKLHYPQPPTGDLPASGIVAVRFQCSPDGRPAGIVLHRKSGDRGLDREAMRAVSRIESLHPLPPGVKPNQTFEADILFATAWSEYQHQVDQLNREAEQRNSWFKGDRLAADGDAPVIALSAGAGVPARSR